MGIIREDNGTTVFLCDICKKERIDKAEGSWDEARLVPVRAKEDGWRLSKRRGGRWEAHCPDCAEFSGYSLRLP